MNDRNQTAGQQTHDAEPVDFPAIGTIWPFLNHKFEMGQWEVVGWLYAPEGRQVISRLVGEPNIIATHPLELIAYKFGTWHPDVDLLDWFEEFTKEFPQYDFLADTRGWVQFPEGYIAYTKDKIVWGLGRDSELALSKGQEELSYNNDYGGDRALFAVRSSGDLEEYIEKNGGDGVAWSICEGVAWLLGDVEVAKSIEGRAIQDGQ